jgi:hypothetical protein
MPHDKRMGPLTNITRYDDERAWFVHIERRGQKVTGWFADNVWGDRKKSQIAAQRFRDELLTRVEGDTRERRRPPKGTRSKTGIVGVTVEEYVVGGRRYRRFVAGWKDEAGVWNRRRFLVQRYGEPQAKALAVEVRKAGVARRQREVQARQREEAGARLRTAPPPPTRVKDPLSRKGIKMPPR